MPGTSLAHDDDLDMTYAYSGPCVHCGHLPDEHGEEYACLRAGYFGNHYTPGRRYSTGSTVAARTGAPH